MNSEMLRKNTYDHKVLTELLKNLHALQHLMLHMNIRPELDLIS